MGLGEAVLSPAAISLISDYFPPARRGTAVGSFLSGIAMGIGAAILIGGGVLHLVEGGALAGTPLATLAPWRLVLLMIGAPGLVWALVILFIREPPRRTTEVAVPGAATERARRDRRLVARCAIYLVVAIGFARRQRGGRLGTDASDPRVRQRPRAGRRGTGLVVDRRIRRRRAPGRLACRSLRRTRRLYVSCCVCLAAGCHSAGLAPDGRRANSSSCCWPCRFISRCRASSRRAASRPSWMLYRIAPADLPWP